MKENDLRITRISTIEIDFKSRLEACLKREMLDNDEIYQKVTSVLEGVRQHGDIAVLEYTNKFDNFSVESFQDLVVTPNQLEDSLKEYLNRREMLWNTQLTEYKNIMSGKLPLLGNMRMKTDLF